MLKFTLPTGELVDVPPEVAGAPDYAKATQGFYDGQAQRVAMELGISVAQLHSTDFAKDPAGFVKANAVTPPAAPPTQVAAPEPAAPAAPASPTATMSGGN